MKTRAIRLSLAFGVASAIAHAQGPNDSRSQLRACSMIEQAEQWECLNKLPRNFAPQPRQVAEADNWILSETTSPVNYTPIVVATASSRRGVDGSSMQLAIHCRGGRTELVIAGTAVLLRGEDYQISYRINDQQRVQLASVSSSFGAGAAFKGNVVPLLQSLPEEGGIAIRLTSRAGPAIDGEFLLGGLKMVRDKIAVACRWPPAASTPSNR